MAEETKPTSSAEVVVASDVPEAEQVEKKSSDNNVTTTKEEEAEKEKPTTEEEKISESASFKEETNVAGELPDPEKKALDELKQLVQQALINHEFTTPVKEVTPPPPPPVVEAKEIEKEEEKEKPIETKEKEEEKEKEKEKPSVSETEKKVEEEKKPIEAPCEPSVVVAEVVGKTTAVDDDGTKTVEAIAETIVSVVVPPSEEECDKGANIVEAGVTAPPPPPEEVSIWGIPLLADDRSDTILLKFLRARDFKVSNAFAMLKSVVAWRKEFGIESLLDEDLGSEQEKVVYMHGFDKEGHPVCYNAYGEFQNKELYHNTLANEEKRTKFLRWRIQFLERSIRKLDFSPDGICTIVQVNDLKNSPGPFKRELRLATNQALQLLQDNYPEFVAKQVFVNVPWWYLAFYKMINPFFTQRTKSKFVFAGPSKTAETLFKYISPEQVPVQYGGLSREGEHEFTTADAVTEEIIKPATKHTIEFPITETCQLVWEVRVVGGEVSYGAEFVPEAEGGYTVIVQKSRKITHSDEPVICDTFKTGDLGKVVLTFDNQTSKKKKLLYRSKTKPSE